MSEVKRKKIIIEEKIELKEIEMQADPCKGSNNIICKHNCCKDCYNGTSPYPTKMY